MTIEERRFTLSSVDGVALDARVSWPSVTERAGAVLLAHGITADLDEGGMFARLADALATRGFLVLRFSYRGHGASAGTQRGVTIGGEMLDVEAAVDWLQDQCIAPLSLVAASFGAVSVCSMLPWLESQLAGLVLWNPVFDLHRTFLRPELEWGLRNFGERALKRLTTDGSLRVDDDFELGRALFTEFSYYDPGAAFAASRVPALVVHGDNDSYVSYEVARDVAAGRANSEFHTVGGSDHGFDSLAHEDEAIGTTVAWLTRIVGQRSDLER